MSRGQGLSINVIVLIAIALIVLIVLVVILTGRVQIFGRGIGSCRGTCVDESAQCPGTSVGVPTPNCNDGTNPVQEKGKCCLPVA